VESGRRRFALAVADSSLEPAYSAGHVLVVSEAAEPRAGDRVLVKPVGMPVLPRLLLSTKANHVELATFGSRTKPIALRRRDIDWMARIVLVRQ
jgi:phage repressor protein C with HTH and peptisase S24 domain